MVRAAAVVAAGVGLSVGLSACGGSPPVTTAGKPDTIVMKNFAFEPATLTVPIGTTISVRNEDGTPHTVTADNGLFSTGDIAAGQVVTFRVTSKGTFPYHCAIHEFMHGSLTVKS